MGMKEYEARASGEYKLHTDGMKEANQLMQDSDYKWAVVTSRIGTLRTLLATEREKLKLH